MINNRIDRPGFLYAFIVCALMLAGASAQAGEDAGEIAAEARKNAAAEAQKNLGDWARSVIGGALERVGEMARETAPDPPFRPLRLLRRFPPKESPEP